MTIHTPASLSPAKQRRVLISGGSSGIGHGIARGLVDAGARVGILARGAPDCWPAPMPARWDPARDWIPADLRDSTRTLQALDTWLQDIDGALDVFVHSAVSYGAARRRPLEDIRLEEWDEVFAINVRALFYLTRHVLPWLRKRPRALILGISSEVAFHTAPGRIDYGTSKAAAYQCLRSLAEELADSSVHVANLLPQGMVDTPGIRRRRAATDSLAGYALPDSFIPAAVHLVETLGTGCHGQSFIVTPRGDMRPVALDMLPSQTRPLKQSGG